MAFFSNRTVNLLNLHYGIHTVAMSGGGAFFAIYLLKSGVSVPGVLLSLALILLGRFATRPLVILFAVRLGLRATVIVGTLLSAAQYPLLAQVHGIGIALELLIATSAFADMVYWKPTTPISRHSATMICAGDRLACAKPSARQSASSARSRPAGCSLPLDRAWRLA